MMMMLKKAATFEFVLHDNERMRTVAKRWIGR